MGKRARDEVHRLHGFSPGLSSAAADEQRRKFRALNQRIAAGRNESLGAGVPFGGFRARLPPLTLPPRAPQPPPEEVASRPADEPAAEHVPEAGEADP